VQRRGLHELSIEAIVEAAADKMACTRGIGGLVLLFLVAYAMDLACARSLQQGTAKPGTAAGAAAGTAAAAVLTMPWIGTPDPKACVGPTTPAKYRFMWWVTWHNALLPTASGSPVHFVHSADGIGRQW
jgi:hypothetical protein